MKHVSETLKDVHCKLERLRLRYCDMTDEGCSALTSALKSNPSHLRELDLSENQLGDSGFKNLSDLLMNPQCKLKILALSDCSITEEDYKALASALRSNPSHLIELDLTGNDPGQSGVKELSDLLQDPNYSLKTLRFLGPAADEACQYVSGIMGINPLLLRELILSGNKLDIIKFVNDFAALLEDKHCQFNKLQLNNNSITAEGCAALTSAFNSNPSNLTELDLSGNKLGNLGFEKICHLLENKQCRLEKLNLSDCSITEEGYKALASALRSNPSHLIELDLTGNDPGQSGVQELSDLLHDPNYSLKTLRLCKCRITEKQFYDILKDPCFKLERLRLRNCDIKADDCSALTSALKSNPSHLRELDLSGNKLGDSGVENLGVLLSSSQCRLEKLQLNNNSITAEGFAALTSVFISNPSKLIELDLSGNKVGNTGIQKICDLLKKPQCSLKKLKLSDCSITEEGYKTLTSSLKSNSNLIELDLTGNDPGKSGVQGLIDLLRSECCKLKTLRFLKSSAAQEACDYLSEVLGTNPLVLRELDLSEDKLGDLDWDKLSALLMDTHSKVEKIK
ncbi:ribonuclease inhibitor-like [Cyprinus carpio]|uniref:Ribonuclease inhibitor-like n=1 Tax=Cyprinus carpio TaxID=7962 RepID=A0A9Q9Y1V2_CYPCA|nr:ribonuclease inhibitor-like [Cyprinus carpio]